MKQGAVSGLVKDNILGSRILSLLKSAVLYLSAVSGHRKEPAVVLDC